jgi:hypothetical protein
MNRFNQPAFCFTNGNQYLPTISNKDKADRGVSLAGFTRQLQVQIVLDVAEIKIQFSILPYSGFYLQYVLVHTI